jgi:hypothetical protein
MNTEPINDMFVPSTVPTQGTYEGQIPLGSLSPFANEYRLSTTPYKFTDYINASTSSSEIFKDADRTNYKYRYALYTSGQRYEELLSPESIELMSSEITKQLKGIHPDGKNIIVPNTTIYSVADSMFQNNPMDTYVLRRMIVSHIVNSIKNEFDQIQYNNKLSIWVTKYDVDSGLKRTNSVKLNQKQRSSYSFMKY